MTIIIIIIIIKITPSPSAITLLKYFNYFVGYPQPDQIKNRCAIAGHSRCH